MQQQINLVLNEAILNGNILRTNQIWHKKLKKMDLSWILSVIAVISTFVAASISIVDRLKKRSRLPPGPKEIPILGHIIVSSAQAAKLFLQTHDHVFASRPPHQAAKYLSWNQKNMSYAAYGPYWRNMRKLCTLELFSSSRTTSFQPMRKQELTLFTKSIKEAANQCIAVDVSGKVSSLVADMSCRMIFGKKYEDKDIHERGFKGVIQEGMRWQLIRILGITFLSLESCTSKD